MNRKSLSLAMVVPMAAAGAVATAPATSAQSDISTFRGTRVSCDLNAQRVYRNQIRVDFRLSTRSFFDRGIWKVEIRQNGRVIESDWARTRNGRLRVVDYTYAGSRGDVFRGYAYNNRTRQWCSDTDVVRSGRPR